MHTDKPLWFYLTALSALILTGCSESESDPPPPPTIDSTFSALQVKVFEEQGCTEAACHGPAAAGELDLTRAVAYEQLVEKPSAGSRHPRGEPGDRNRSYLYLKLLAADDAEAVQVAGSPMPISGGPIPANLLEAVRLWIYAGAPETGTL